MRFRGNLQSRTLEDIRPIATHSAALLALLVSVLGCQVTVSLDANAFRCEAEPKTCPPGYTCSNDVCTPDGTTDAGHDAPLADEATRVTVAPSAANITASNVPVLLVLSVSRVDHSLAGSAGESLLFMTDAGERLEHEVSHWDPSGDSLVWVLLPTLEASTTFDIGYIAQRQSAFSRAAADVWSRYGLVVHFDGSAVDSSPAGLALNLDGATLGVGRLGGAAEFDGVDDVIELGNDLPTFAGASAATASAWIKTTPDPIGPGALVEFSDDALTTSRVLLNISDGIPSFGVNTRAGATERVIAAEALSADWHWVLGTADLEAGVAQIYIDGSLSGELSLDLSDPTFPATNSATAVLGRNDTSPVGFLAGELDEVRAAAVYVDENWVRAQYLSMTDGLFVFETTTR